jgi:moderate conductance mechanosensitive channel
MTSTPVPLSLTLPGSTTLLWIVGFFLGAWILSWLLGKLMRHIIKLSSFAPRGRIGSPERARTLQVLVASLITFVAFLIAIMASLSLFISTSTLIWILGLFSAAFGLSAKPLVSDLLSGMGFIFSDTFDIGEKVEFVIAGSPIQGVIEEVNLTTTMLRAPSGEQFTIPNGEIRIVRNFSRGKFSTVNIALHIASTDLERCLTVLNVLGDEIYNEQKDLVERWQLLSTADLTSSNRVELNIIARATLGQGADMKLRLIKQIHDRLTREGIQLID